MSDEIVKVGPSSLARPDFIKADDTRGTENIKRENLILPRLSLAQPQSPELSEENPKYVPGLKKGDAFNTLTGQVYGGSQNRPGQPPVFALDVVIVRIEDDRFVEFNPLDGGGGIKDFNVPADDDRTKFTTTADGKTVKPVATRFSEFVALRLPELEPIALSFKGAGLKAARTLQSFIALRGKVPSFASVFTLTPTIVTNAKGTFSIFVVKLKGNVDEPTYLKASELYDSFKGREAEVREALNRNIEREPGSDDAAPASTTEF